MSSINKIRLFIIIANLVFIYWLYFENTLNTSHKDSIALSMIIHSVALATSLTFFNNLKIPFVSVLSFFNIFGFAIAPANVDFQIFQLGVFNPEIYSEINLGYIIFYVFHFIFLRVQIKKRSIKRVVEIKEFDQEKMTKQLVILQNYSLIFYIISKILTLPISGLNEFVELLTIGSFMIGFFRGFNSWFKNLITITLLIFVIVQLLVSGLIYPLIFFGVFILALIFLYGVSSLFSKLFIASGIVFGIFFSVLFNPVKMQYRQIDLTGKSLFDRVLVIQELISNDRQGKDKKVDDDKTFFWRLTYPLSATSLVKEKTPSKVPYWNGESYTNLLYKFIPRIIWKDKPSEEMGQLFGHRYEILNTWNFTTSMNTPIIAEAYMNFGITGFYGMFILMSFILARAFITSNIKNRMEVNSLNVLLSGLNVAIVLTFLIQWESNFSMIFGKIIILFIVNQLIEWLAFRKQDSNDKLLHLNLMR
jgi:hypothetical protein